MEVSPVEPPRRPDGSRLLELGVGLATGAAAIVLVALIPQLRHSILLALHGHFVALRAYIRSMGAGGPALLLGLMLAHAVVFYPSEIVTATAGYVFGFAAGLSLAVSGWLLTALLSYALGRVVGGPLLQALLGARFTGLQRRVQAGGVPLLLAARLIPVVPFALLGYAAGAGRVGIWRFSWTTVAGYLPLSVLVAYLGSSARTPSLGNPLIWTAGGLVVLLIGAHRAYARWR